MPLLGFRVEADGVGPPLAGVGQVAAGRQQGAVRQAGVAAAEEVERLLIGPGDRVGWKKLAPPASGAAGSQVTLV